MRTEDDVKEALEKTLRREVPERIWEELVSGRYVSDFLRGEMNLPDLAEQAGRLIKLVQDCRQGATGEKKDHPRPVPAYSPNWPVITRLQAREAAQHPWVQAFRRQHLTREALLEVFEEDELDWWLKARPTPEGLLHREIAELWLVRQGQARPWDEGGVDWLVVGFEQETPPGYPWGRSFPVTAQGPLRDLKNAADCLRSEYGWSEHDAVIFTLTGAYNRTAAAGYVTYMPNPPLTRRRHRIVLEVDAGMSPAEVRTIYSRFRQIVCPRRPRFRSRSPKILALIAFVLDRPEERTWRDRMREWNSVHPQWSYKEPDLMNRDYTRAVNTLGFEPESH